MKYSVLEDIQHDINDIIGLSNCPDDTSLEMFKNQLNGIAQNLKENFEEFKNDYIENMENRQNKK